MHGSGEWSNPLNTKLLQLLSSTSEGAKHLENKMPHFDDATDLKALETKLPLKELHRTRSSVKIKTIKHATVAALNMVQVVQVFLEKKEKKRKVPIP